MLVSPLAGGRDGSGCHLPNAYLIVHSAISGLLLSPF